MVSDAPAPVYGAARIRLVPLPLYATLPNEGSTYGVMPVFFHVDAAGQATSIIAPSISWNSAAGVNTTFRYYDVADQARTLSLIVAASTNVNRSLRLEYKDVPGTPKRFTFEGQLIARRSLFFRYFGAGPDSNVADQSSYTRTLALLSVREGVNLLKHVNVGVRAGVRWDQPERRPIFALPATQDLFPNAVGLDGAALASAELSVRFDSRDGGDYDLRGLASELHLAFDQGLHHSDSFWQLTWHTRVLVPETSFLTGAARLYWTDELGGESVPFYYRSALGGEVLFRGFPDDRFVDRGAWEAEVEQRFRLLQTHFFNVVTDWRIDPFVAVGQVYPRFDALTSQVRRVIGLGFRAWVHPNVLGRVDVGYSNEGASVYVVLGYPY
ncbi:MAG TPA: BamA/TamA family outer membrane protein [Polyangia bacterium]|nr:BamA/TamA family outer membrane protein [Polyangia bacterium]